MPNEPRRWLDRPDWFGRRDHVAFTPKPDSLTERGERAAAYQQHIASFQVRRILDDRRLDTNYLADLLDITPDTLRRKLRGERTASHAELIAWALELGIDVLPVPDSTNDLEP